MQTEFTFKAGGHRCVAVRSDRPWGHGLKVNIFGDRDRLLNVVTFCSHPEFPGHDILQAMNTEQLVELAAGQLNELESGLSRARMAELQIFVAFKVPPK
jgi:hypothetical protein